MHPYPQQEQNLQQLVDSFMASCQHAYKDPCDRVGRDPLRKLAVNERVLGSVLYHVRHGLELKHLRVGLLLGYIYAMAFEQISFGKAIQHLKQQLIQSGLSSAQKHQLYAFIRCELQCLEGHDMPPAEIQERVLKLIAADEMLYPPAASLSADEMCTWKWGHAAAWINITWTIELYIASAKYMLASCMVHVLIWMIEMFYQFHARRCIKACDGGLFCAVNAPISSCLSCDLAKPSAASVT